MAEFPKTLTGIQFLTYSDEEIRRMSVAEVHNPVSFGDMGHPNINGLQDPRLGPKEQADVCKTCGLRQLHCPGHFGHVELPVPVYNPIWFQRLFIIVRGSCFHCHRFLFSSTLSEYLMCTLRLITAGLWEKLDEMHLEYPFGSLDDKFIVNEMKNFVQQALEEAEVPEKMEKSLRFITQEKADKLTEYIDLCCKTAVECRHCLMPPRPLRCEQHVRIFFSGGLSDRAMAKAIKAPQGVELDPDFKDDLKTLRKGCLLTVQQIRNHMRRLWDFEQETLSLLCRMLQVPIFSDSGVNSDPKARPSDVFFLSVVPVIPPNSRPVRHMKNKLFESAKNGIYVHIMTHSESVKEAIKNIKSLESQAPFDPADDVTNGPSNPDRDQLFSQLKYHTELLQSSVNHLLDSNLTITSSSDSLPEGLKQVIEKKQGLFRKHMMGKRVDYAARSVISPDLFISVDEVGLPVVFAKCLTFPEPVSLHNLERLRRAVIAGPNQHPGATHVVDELGCVKLLTDVKAEREAVANTLATNPNLPIHMTKPKVVHRHIRNGDMLLMNRQPTLHRPSIQAHKCHILPGERTIRLHYANCNAYNADFDGDEMNAHFPQTFIGQSEARQIASTQNQYLAPKSGSPLAGLIQDHVIGGVTLSTRGHFFNRSDYQQLVYSGLTDQMRTVRLLPPAILKPEPLWSGKQVISTVLRNIMPVKADEYYLNLTGSSKISAKSWLNSDPKVNLNNMGEEIVVIRQGELLQGVLDKNHYGATANGLVHACYELYGGGISSDVLTSLGRLFTTYLSSRGFTLGVRDILCRSKADRKRRKVMGTAPRLGNTAISAALGVDEPEDGGEENQSDREAKLKRMYAEAHFDKDRTRLAELDLSMKQVSDGIQNDITRAIMPRGLLRQFPENNLQLMVTAGAKGSSVNCMQISCLLGQIELEGRRPPLSVSGRSLPSFRPYETTPRAGGFVDGRFLSGIRPQEYFFHCMAGREGLVDTACKTSRSGYLQRCLIKHLEGIMVEYDSTVRDSDGSIVQFYYGEDSLDTTKVNMMSPKQLPFLVSNQRFLTSSGALNRIKSTLNTSKAKRANKKLEKSTARLAALRDVKRYSPFLSYTTERDVESISACGAINEKLHRTNMSVQLQDEFRALKRSKRQLYDVYGERIPDPVINVYNPNKYFHSVPESVHKQIRDYTQEHLGGEDATISPEEFSDLISLFCLRSRMEPGEAVGVLAAQSIGEPSTQMTLNTFHFAGRGEMNVTLGIPRLREILMVASKIPKTPTMDIPCLKTSHAERRVVNLQLRLNSVTVYQLLEKVSVTTSLMTRCSPSARGKIFKVRMDFLPPAQYCGTYPTTPRAILKIVEKNIPALISKLYMMSLKQATELKLTMSVSRPKAVQSVSKNVDVMDDAEPDVMNDAEPDVVDPTEPQPAEFDEPGTKPNDEDMEDMRKEAGEDFDKGVEEEIAKHNEEIEYDGSSSEDEGVSGDENNLETEREESDLGKDNLSDSEPKHLHTKQLRQEIDESQREMHKTRVEAVCRNNIIQYTYDTAHELWCEITFQFPLSMVDVDMAPLVEQASRTIFVRDAEDTVTGVTKAILSQPKKPEELVRLRTDGVNIQRMFQYHQILDINNLYSNDIHSMAATFGIEAAAKVLIKEVRDVFAAYGIAVNYRHLSLIADYMTCDGVYKPCSRHGISSNSSVLQKMTFESSLKFLQTAILNGEKDDLDSPSSRLVVGRPVKVGTGNFTLLQKLFSAQEE